MIQIRTGLFVLLVLAVLSLSGEVVYQDATLASQQDTIRQLMVPLPTTPKVIMPPEGPLPPATPSDILDKRRELNSI